MLPCRLLKQRQEKTVRSSRVTPKEVLSHHLLAPPPLSLTPFTQINQAFLYPSKWLHVSASQVSITAMNNFEEKLQDFTSCNQQVFHDKFGPFKICLMTALRFGLTT